MNWTHELMTSTWWLARVFSITLVCFALVVWFLAKRTVWGRQFWAISGDYFSPRRSWKPILVVAFMLLLTLAGVRLQVLLSNWYNTMYSSLQNLDEAAFWLAMWLFAVLATAHVIRSLLDFYVQQAFTIHWRTWLNEKLLSSWLEDQSYYRTQNLERGIDNPDQRIQYDVTVFVQSSLSLSMGVVDALVSTVAFTLILWGLSGPLALLGFELPRAMVFLVFIYVLIATVLAVYIGRPLVRLNFLNEQFGADYRYALVRLREYAESIAFYAGEKVEGVLLRNRFGQVIGNAWDIVYRSLKFLGFNFSVGQAAVVFPVILQAQRFFTKQITLGDLMQTTQAFGRLQDNLSFFRNAYDQFASYRATLDRLTGFNQGIERATRLPRPNLTLSNDGLTLQDLTVQTPSGKPLITDLNLNLHGGQALLIRGASGSGKTTLLRAIAGLWPHSQGHIQRPGQHLLFLSQKPYIPLGTLRDALFYPQTGARGNPNADARTREVLEQVQLGHLTNQLDQPNDWARILSLGEQQRLAFGRLLLARPRLVFLDEATSAMDEGLEDAMYRLVRQQLPDTLIVSVGHRSTLLRHHSLQLNLEGEGRWALGSNPA